MHSERRHATWAGTRFAEGVTAAFVAEAMFIAFMTTVAWVRGADPWTASRMAGALVLGPDAVEPPGLVAADVAIGLGLHVAMAVLVGLLYAALLPRIGVSPVAGGIITGMLLYLLGFWILPLLFPAWLAPFWLPPFDRLLQAIGHLAYGYAFGRVFALLASRAS